MKEQQGETFFAIRHISSAPRIETIQPKTISIYWDASYSGRKRDTEREISFLKQYISNYGVTDVYITPFNYKAKSPVHFKNNNGWINYLRSLDYEGATQLGALDLNAIQADVIFLVSDGYNSIGSAIPKNRSQAVFCLHASSITDNQTLNTIIGKSGGRNIDLNKETISHAIKLAGAREKVLLGIRSASGKTLVDIEEHDQLTGISFISGTIQAAKDTLFFDYGNNNQIITTEKVVLDASADCKQSIINRLPALTKFDGLLRKTVWHELLLFGKAERIVTYNTSFIVLEKPEDYVKFNIEPPKELDEQCEQIQPGFLLRNKNQNREERLRLTAHHNQFEILAAVANHYNNRIRRWGGTESIVLNRQTIANINSTSAEDKSTPKDAMANLSAAGFMGNANMEEVVVTGYGVARRKSSTGAISVIRGDEIFRSSTTIEQALNGRVAGLHITQSNSQFTPGSVSSIRIRGASSFQNGNPLFVLDGMPITGDVNGRLNINDYVSVNDIEQIEVLKDASATAIYGGRGANGVIVFKTKRGKNNNWYNTPSSYKLSAMEDVEYLQEIKAVDKNDKLAKYKELQLLYENDAAFYLDMAQHLSEQGFKKEAKSILTTAAELLPNNLSIQKIIASFFEQWGEWGEADTLYEAILQASPANPMAYHDLALVFTQSGQHQKAIDVLYKGIQHDHQTNEYWYSLQKDMLLNELNAIVAIHRDSLDTTHIPSELLKPLAVDLRIALQNSGGQLYGVTIVEPDGKESKDWQGATKNGGYFTQAYYYDHTKEYQIKTAPKGRYRIKVNYYDNHYNSGNQPGVIKLVVYKNFGKANQTVTVENIMMDNQRGEIEIATVKVD